MKTEFAYPFIHLIGLPVHYNEPISSSPVSYLIGGIIALFILGYLIYTLLHPEKF